MPRKSDEIIKGFIGEIGTMIDARHKTLEINLKAHVNDAINKSEERIRKDMATKDELKKLEEKMATKDDIKNMATKDDILRLEKKIDKTVELQHQLDILKERVKTLEENARIHN